MSFSQFIHRFSINQLISMSVLLLFRCCYLPFFMTSWHLTLYYLALSYFTICCLILPDFVLSCPTVPYLSYLYRKFVCWICTFSICLSICAHPRRSKVVSGLFQCMSHTSDSRHNITQTCQSARCKCNCAGICLVDVFS